MATLSSTLKFNKVKKDRLYYSRFQYSVSFFLQEVSCLRELDHEYVDMILKRRIHHREISKQRSVKSTIITRRWADITDVTISNVHTLVDVLLNAQQEHKLVVSVSSGWIYTNDLAFVEQLSKCDFLLEKIYSEAIVDRPKDTIRLKNSRYKHRSYFKVLKLSEKEKGNLDNFFKNNPDDIRVSPSLIQWLDCDYKRTQEYFFIDHVDERWLLMLALIHPGLIRKTMTIITA